MGEYGEGGGREENYKSETGSESEADNKGDSSSDTEEDLGTDKEYDLDGSLDLSEADKYDFDGSLDFSEMEKNEKGYLDELKGGYEEKKEDDLNEESELEEEKEETKWDDIDWSEEKLVEREKTIWDDIDWSEEKQGEREKTIWDDIDWSEEKQGEREKTIWDDIDWSEDKHDERDKIENDKDDEQNEEYNKEDYVENIESQSTSTVLTSEIEEIEEHMEHQEQKEEIEIYPEEYQDDTEPIVNADEIEFIKDVEELAEHAREIKAEDEDIEPQSEKENAAYYAEQYYEKLKEKEVVNEQNSKEEQETEELRQEVAGELKGDQESNYKSDELEEEAAIKASEEVTSTEEFEYLWEIRDKLEILSPEEIEEVMHEAEEMYETLKNAEKLYEAQGLEKLKLVDHEDEATGENLKEDLDREDLVEQAVELENKLFQQGESQEEIDKRVEESIETIKFEEDLEEIIEAQELEKLKLVDHEDEASIEDLKEDLDRVDLVEQAVELEENLFQQEESQEEIDKRVEESIETTKFEEKLEKIIEKEQESIVNEKLKKHDLEINEQSSNEDVENQEDLEILKPELDAIESESENSKDLIEESTKIESEEYDKEESEHLQELYRQETNKRPIYARKKTKGYSQWLEKRELGSEKIKNSKSESEKIKEIKEEDWKTTFKEWVEEASEEKCSAELKSELKKALEMYNEFESLTQKFLELYEKSQYEKLSEKANIRLKFLTERLQKLDPIQFDLLANIRAIKEYINEQYWHDFWNRPLVNRVINKFFKHISQKILKLKELINANDDIIPEEMQPLVNKEMETPKIPKITLSDPIGKNSTYIKNSFLWEYIKKRDKNILNEHTTIDLLADLYIEINRYPQVLASIFPDRVNRFPERELSVIWGKYETFITKWKRKIRDNKQEGFRDEDLELLRINLKKHLGNKVGNCSKIINLYKSGKLTYIEFIDQLTKELGRYSYRLPLTMEEFSLILGGYVNFTNDILGKINNPSHQRYNPNYKFSIERLDDIKDNIQTILGDKAKKILMIIRKYKNFNPNLKKYKHQQHTIDNPRFFKIIDLILTAYLFGLMCADGYRASKSYRIGIELKSDDKDRLILFAKSIGLDINRIRSRVRFYRINGVLKSSQMSVLSFICKDMHNDFANNQYSSSKADRKYIPNCILDAIHKAKQEALEMGINWMGTYWGMVALAWLLGYYDGDGTLDMRGNQMSARIYSANKQFLEQIRKAFGIRNKVLTNTEPGEVRIVFGKPVVSRGYYLLTLGVKVFIGMLHSFSDSMQRKRPLKYRNSTD